jgi:drug/metabolite transporter (DMT)-like permease
MMTENFRGALLMMICMGAFVLNDAFVRLAGDTLPLGQILFFRGLITTFVLVIAAWYAGIFRIQVSQEDKLKVVVRSIIEGLTAYFFLTAVLHMPFANVTAILQILPMTVTLAAAFVFKETVGRFRTTLILIGFIGVLFIIKPSVNGFNVYSFYALIAVFLITLRDLITRKLSTEVHTLLPTVSASFGVLLFSIILMFNTPFQSLDIQNSFFILMAAFFIIFGYYTAVLVMRSGEISFISPFRYSAILFALIIGFVFFEEIPDNQAFLGMLIIATSGIVLLFRNKKIQSN